MGYLTAFFNSRIFRFAFKDYFPELLGDTRELSKVFFENVTIKEVSAGDLLFFENIVQEIQELKVAGKDTNYLEFEAESRLAAIYTLSGNDLALIAAKEDAVVPGEDQIRERSSAVNS